MRKPLVVTTIVVLACGPALADSTPAPAPTPAPPPAAAPRYEIAVDPIGWLDHAYAVSASVAIGRHAVLRGDVGLHTTDGTSADSTQQASASVRLFLDRAFHGPFVEPGVLVRASPLYLPCVGELGTWCTSDRATATSVEVLLGWQWTYASHYTLAGALGMSRPIDETTAYVDAAQPRLEGYVRLGYAW